MDPELSALVVLRPGRPLADAELTAEHAELLRADPTAVESARRFFREAGFELGPLVALGFAVTGPRSLFESVFGTTVLVEGADTAVSATTDTGMLELPVDRLPGTVAAVVQAVTFSPPPDFGPTRFEQ